VDTKILRNLISKLYGFYENWSISKYDGVISVTPHIVERLKRINPNTVMITNYPIVNKDEEIIRKPQKQFALQVELVNNGIMM